MDLANFGLPLLAILGVGGVGGTVLGMLKVTAIKKEIGARADKTIGDTVQVLGVAAQTLVKPLQEQLEEMHEEGKQLRAEKRAMQAELATATGQVLQLQMDLVELNTVVDELKKNLRTCQAVNAKLQAQIKGQ